MLSQSNRKARFAPNWHVQCAHIRVELARATAKLPALCEIPVPKDTSLCRSWWPAETSNELPELPNSKTRFFLLWATANQLLVTKHGGITGHILSCLCEYLGIPCGCHPAQLHIEEFVALEADEVSRNFNLQSLAKSKPLKNAPAKHANVREEDDSDQLDVPRETRAQGDVVVGELESDFEDMDDLYQAAVPEGVALSFPCGGSLD